MLTFKLYQLQSTITSLFLICGLLPVFWFQAGGTYLPILLFVYFLYLFVAFNSIRVKNKEILIIMLIAVSIVSSAIKSGQDLSFLKSFVYFVICLTFPIIMRSFVLNKQNLNVIITCITVNLILACLEIFSQLYWYDLYEILVEFRPQFASTSPIMGINRSYGFYLEPSFMGISAVLLYMLFSIFASSNNFFKTKIMLLITVFLSFSTSAYFLLFILETYRALNDPRITRGKGLILFIFTCFIIQFWPAIYEVIERIYYVGVLFINQNYFGSSGTRLHSLVAIYDFAIQDDLRTLFLGNGYGNTDEYLSKTYPGTHLGTGLISNAYSALLLSVGFSGLILILYYFFIIFSGESQRFIVITILLMSLLFYGKIVGYYFWFFLGLFNYVRGGQSIEKNCIY